MEGLSSQRRVQGIYSYIPILMQRSLSQLNSIHIIVLRCPSAGTRPDLPVLLLGFLQEPCYKRFTSGLGFRCFLQGFRV